MLGLFAFMGVPHSDALADRTRCAVAAFPSSPHETCEAETLRRCSFPLCDDSDFRLVARVTGYDDVWDRCVQSAHELRLC